MADAARLRIEYSSLAALRRHPAEWWHDVLALVSYAAPDELTALPLEDVPAAHVHLPVLPGRLDAAEIWHFGAPMRSGRNGRVRYRRSDRLVFASLSVAEQEFDPALDAASASALRAATKAAYAELFGTLESLGFAHPLRIWNVLPQINGDTPEGERYWHFNDARQEAFRLARRAICGNVPAASALGSPGTASSPLTIYCLAAAEAPIALENPRQMHAWDYPARYGPRSPTFARACLEAGPIPALFVSGTSSIVGHASAHAGDAGAQTRETLRNIEAVLLAANARLGTQRFSLGSLSYKVYVRRSPDREIIERELRTAVGSAAPTLYLGADICRRDLLVEIEAVGT